MKKDLNSFLAENKDGPTTWFTLLISSVKQETLMIAFPPIKSN